MSIRLAGTNTDRVSTADRAVAGRQPDGSGPSGGGSPTAAAGAQASLPTYSNDGVSPYKVGIHRPGGTSSSYNVTFRIGAGAYATAYSFPFTLTMASAAQTFDLYAVDGAKTPSYLDTQSWNSLFK